MCMRPCRNADIPLYVDFAVPESRSFDEMCLGTGCVVTALCCVPHTRIVCKQCDKCRKNGTQNEYFEVKFNSLGTFENINI